MLVPAPIEQLPIPLDRLRRDQHHTVPTGDQILPQGLMIVGRGLQTQNHLLKAMLNSHCLCLQKEPLKTLSVIPKDQPPEKGLSRGRAEKGFVPLLGHIDPHDQVLLRTSDLLLQLTELLQSGTILFIHWKPPC